MFEDLPASSNRTGQMRPRSGSGFHSPRTKSEKPRNRRAPAPPTGPPLPLSPKTITAWPARRETPRLLRESGRAGFLVVLGP